MPIFILVVDDEPAIRELFEDMLMEEGYLVQTAATGQHALDLYHNQRPDLIFIDIMMPGMDGMTLCRRIATLPGIIAPPMILMSGGTRISFIDGPYHAFLAKPFDLTKLLDLIHAVLNPSP
ncbi:response regulator [Herpetosiphon giganteus]|uniref:response regulator n=1 Tax=Herpetosiphon giganteus TaxID=2029754 RepID=UPI001956B9D7|nr:response regulator [Herpetosiphon giganteus]MBM7843779.1 CheY-like chemotaxis protein [Herpetosiphon giganteus]